MEHGSGGVNLMPLAMSVPSGRDVSGILARQGWTMRGRAQGGAVRFAVRRAGEQRDFGEVVARLRAGVVAGSERALTPPVHLQVKRKLGAGLRPSEAEGLENLALALRGVLESLSRRRTTTGAGLALAESHEGKEGREILLRTTLACNQRCPFCFVPLTGRHADWGEIKREIDGVARDLGTSGTLTISGGEPTLDPRLPRIVAMARRKGWRRFKLQTNGLLLARTGLLGKLIRGGVRMYMVSFHSHRPELYDKITGSRGHFTRAVEGLTRLIHSPQCHVTINVVVNAHNYHDLPRLMGFLGRLCVGLPRRRRPGVYFSMLNEAGHEKAPSWAVGLDLAAPYLRRAVERCRREGLLVERFGSETSFPVCLLNAPGRIAARRTFPQDRVRYAQEFLGQAGRIGRAKRPACGRCRYDARCLGVPAQYARMFGLRVLRPRFLKTHA